MPPSNYEELPLSKVLVHLRLEQGTNVNSGVNFLGQNLRGKMLLRIPLPMGEDGITYFVDRKKLMILSNSYDLRSRALTFPESKRLLPSKNSLTMTPIFTL